MLSFKLKRYHFIKNDVVLNSQVEIPDRYQFRNRDRATTSLEKERSRRRRGTRYSMGNRQHSSRGVPSSKSPRGKHHHTYRSYDSEYSESKVCSWSDDSTTHDHLLKPETRDDHQKHLKYKVERIMSALGSDNLFVPRIQNSRPPAGLTSLRKLSYIQERWVQKSGRKTFCNSCKSIIVPTIISQK